MPLLHTEILAPECVWGLWEISESEAELLALAVPVLAANFGEARHNAQRRQQLAARLVAAALMERLGLSVEPIFKNEQGRPCLHHAYVSLSHSGKWAAAMLHKCAPVGLDIEQVQARLLRMAPRLMDEAELAHIASATDATRYWCAKEALYKHYAKRGLDFREHLHVEALPAGHGGRVQGENGSYQVSLHFRHWAGGAMVAALCF